MTKISIDIDPESVVRLRGLSREDIARIRELCQQWFPIEYPDQWYEDITTDPRFFTLGAEIGGQLSGLVVAEIKPQLRCNLEDQDLVSRGCGIEPLVAYILSLGVVRSQRRKGIGGLLLNHLIDHLITQVSKSGSKCKAVFLHVLTTNTDAIKFYESQKFAKHKFLPHYYFIDGKCFDAFSYIKYLNGGCPPFTFAMICSSAYSYCKSCSFDQPLISLRNMVQYLTRKFFRLVKIPSRITHTVARCLLKPNTTHKSNKFQQITYA